LAASYHSGCDFSKAKKVLKKYQEKSLLDLRAIEYDRNQYKIIGGTIMSIKVLVISASEFSIPSIQPILRQLIKFALLKNIKVGILSASEEDEQNIKDSLHTLDNDNEINLDSIFILPINQNAASDYRSELARIGDNQVWLEGKNPELLFFLSQKKIELGDMDNDFHETDYPSVLFLTGDLQDGGAAQAGKFTICFRLPGTPTNLNYLQNAAVHLGVNAALEIIANDHNRALIQCAQNLAILFTNNGETPAGTRDRSDTTASAHLSYTLVPVDADNDDMDLASNAGTMEITTSTRKRLSVPPRPTSTYVATPSSSHPSPLPVQASSSSSSSSQPAATAVVYSKLGADPIIKALVFSYHSIANEISSSNNELYLPFLLVELASLLNLEILIIRSSTTTENSKFDQAMRKIGKSDAIKTSDNTLDIMHELSWSINAKNASSDNPEYSAANIYFVSSNLARVNELKQAKYSAYLCHMNPKTELLPVVNALKRVFENSSMPRALELVTSLDKILAGARANDVDEEFDGSSLVRRQQNNQVDHDVEAIPLNRHPATTTSHSRAWVAGFFATSALGGAAGAGVGEYFIPEDAFTKEVHAALIASCSIVGAGMFGLAYWGITQVVQLCCSSDQQYQQFDDNDERSPLLRGAPQAGPLS
jgi:hypothetical protein